MGLWRSGILPMINSTYHLAVIDEDACTGCGVCSHFCPEEAISLQEGLRRVFILPPRMRKA